MSRIDRRIDKMTMGWAKYAVDVMGHITDLRLRVGEVKASYIELVNAYGETVECEKCGCLLNKGTAIRGESVIEGVSGDIPWHLCTYDGQTGCAIRPDVTETIREVYYCKVHQPKVKK